MGFCCSTNITDPEIEEARTVHEIIVILNNRKLGIPIEKKEIEEFLIDPTKEVKSIGIENIDNESLKKRIPFLTKMESAYQKMIQLLEENNTNLDVNDIKPYVKNVTNKYFITYDPNNDLEKELKKFVEYMENFRKNKKL
jgi:hypothetical protein